MIAVPQSVGTTENFCNKIARDQADQYGELGNEYQLDHDVYVASGEASPLVKRTWKNRRDDVASSRRARRTVFDSAPCPGFLQAL